MQSTSVKWISERRIHDGSESFYCSITLERTPGGSLPSPRAARKPSCCRARASFASDRKLRGSVMARSLMTRRLSWTLHCVWGREMGRVSWKEGHHGKWCRAMTHNSTNLGEVVHEDGILHALLSCGCCNARDPQLTIGKQDTRIIYTHLVSQPVYKTIENRFRLIQAALALSGVQFYVLERDFRPSSFQKLLSCFKHGWWSWG